MLDRFVHPLVSIEQEVVAGQESGGSKIAEVLGSEFVGREHPLDHFIVRSIVIEGFDDPIAPVPHVQLAVAELVTESPPIAKPPYVHPVSGPAFAVLGILEQSVDGRFIPSCIPLARQAVPLLGLGWQADQIDIEPAQQHVVGGLGLGNDTALGVEFVQESVDGMRGPVLCEGDCWSDQGLEGPVLAGIWIGLFVGDALGPLADPSLDDFDLLGFEWFSFVLRRHANARLAARDSLDDPALERFIRDDRRSRIATGKDTFERIEP